METLIVGNTYNNAQLMEIFKISGQGGMRKSNTTNSLVLISNRVQKRDLNPYEDKWIGDELHYTGMGMSGDQSIQFMQNKTLNDSNNTDIKLYLFEVFVPKEYIYLGRVKLSKPPYTIKERDNDGNLRTVIKFPLKVQNDLPEIHATKIIENDNKIISKLKKLETEKLWLEAIKADELNRQEFGQENILPKVTRVSTNRFNRDPAISEYVKRISKGVCGLCDNFAPFNDKNGHPYLHSHHIEYLSNGGLDVIENCIAVCPNCHEKIHVLEDSVDRAKLLEKVRLRK
ncbi:HNH endonuclease [Erysipelothrix aquatica]|uniref:HNH endonuclease n=1 Tax=Erysipelothrix aquatica TaxID=2683714 RepID=UPI001359A47C|nr:HNH endonuclease signature motif containing protein [Erysipelothrix aquatica]